MSADKKEFYSDAEGYWKKIPATVDGMLGGYSHISSTDIAGSTQFIRHFIKNTKLEPHQALDCGAGIGRITKRLLLPLCNKVDMVELCQVFLDQAPEFIGEDSKRVERRICSGLQDFVPEDGHYDIIWCQWVLGHLTDADFVTFFQRCQRGLTEHGMIFVKENIANTTSTDFDEKDSSFTRTYSDLVNLFSQTGLTIVKEEKQKNFPKEIFTVQMFALR